MYPYAITFSQDDLFSYDITSENGTRSGGLPRKKC